MAVYLDSSAIVKLVVEEPESGALRRYLRRRPERVSSALARVEVVRAAWPSGAAAVARARLVLRGLRILALDDEILHAAADFEPRSLRSLDAIHLASARVLGAELEALVTYDRRMAEAAEARGLVVASPGAS